MDVAVVYNTPCLAADDADAASEAGVLEAVTAVSEALKHAGHRPVPLPIASPGQAYELLFARRDVPVYFNLFEGFAGRGAGESHVTSLLELTGCAVTGSPADCLALARDKPRTKWLLRGANILTPRFCYVPPGRAYDASALRELLNAGPVIVKPAHEDASLGISTASVVETLDALGEQLSQVHSRFGAAMVEQFITGREFNVSVVALPEPKVLPLAEIEFGETFAPDRKLVTYAAKWEPASEQFRQTPVCCPAEVASELAAQIAHTALSAFSHLGCRDYARVDLRIDANEQVYVLEVNANPDISPSAGFARALGAAGFTYDRFIAALVEHAVGRCSGWPL